MKSSNKRYYLVETQTDEGLTPTLARLKRGVEDEYTKVRVANVTDLVTDVDADGLGIIGQHFGFRLS